MYNNQMLKIERAYSIKTKEKTMKLSDYYPKYVDYSHTHELCTKCEIHNRNWSCPEFDTDMSYVWKRYDNIDLYFLQLIFDDEFYKQQYSQDEIDTILHITLFKEKNKLLQKLNPLKNEKNGMLLSTGYCNLCPICSKIDSKPCRYPKQKLHSIESLGGLVTKTSEELFDTKLKWIDMDNGIIPNYLSLLMAIIY